MRTIGGLTAFALLSLVLAGHAGAVCGDDVLDPGEQCDEGATNGSNGCCSAGCTFIDADADGICDRDDLCASPLIEKARIVNWDIPTGSSDYRSFHGRLTVPFPFSPPLDPAVNGVEFVIVDEKGQEVLRTPLPGGAMWRVNGSRTLWRFEQLSPSGTLIRKATIKDLSRSRPGVVKFAFKSGGSAFHPPIPLTGTVFLSPPDGVEGQCGQARPRCVRQRDGQRITCR